MTQSEDAADATDRAIAAAVAAFRQKRGVTVDQLAVYSGLNRASLYRKLKGEVSWKATDIAALSRYLEVEPNDLFSGDPALVSSRGTRTSIRGCAWWVRRRRQHTRVTLRHLAVA